MKSCRLILDGEERRDWPAAEGMPVFSADSKRVAYPAQGAVIVDGIPTPHRGRMLNGSLTFSPDGTRVAFAAAADKASFVTVDGRVGRLRPGLGRVRVARARSFLTFSPDSRHVIYAVTDASGARVAVDEQFETTTYDDIGEYLAFDTPHVVAFVARRGGEILRVTIDLTGSPSALAPTPRRGTQTRWP